jgi:hypothetical protein
MVFCNGKCLRDDCASEECKVVDAALADLKSSAYLELQNAFNNGDIDMTNSSQTLSAFLSKKSESYDTLAQHVATTQCGGGSVKTADVANLYCETLIYCGDDSTFDLSWFANTKTLKPPVSMPSTKPKSPIVSEPCFYSCEPCGKVVPATGLLIDLIITDTNAAFYGGILGVSSNTSATKTYLDSYIANMCVAVSNTNHKQGCSIETSSKYCSPPVAASGVGLYPSLWLLGVILSAFMG